MLEAPILPALSPVPLACRRATAADEGMDMLPAPPASYAKLPGSFDALARDIRARMLMDAACNAGGPYTESEWAPRPGGVRGKWSSEVVMAPGQYVGCHTPAAAGHDAHAGLLPAKASFNLACVPPRMVATFTVPFQLPTLNRLSPTPPSLCQSCVPLRCRGAPRGSPSPAPSLPATRWSPSCTSTPLHATSSALQVGVGKQCLAGCPPAWWADLAQAALTPSAIPCPRSPGNPRWQAVSLRDADWGAYNGEIKVIELFTNHESWYGDVTPSPRCKAGQCLENGQPAGAAAQA